jgi:hypothetical protein
MMGAARKAKSESLFWWCGLLSAISQFAINLTDNPIAKIVGAVAALYVVIRGTAALMGWLRVKYRNTYPFDLAICEGRFAQGPRDEFGQPHSFPLYINAIEGLVLGFLTLRFISKSEIKIKDISVRFTRKKEGVLSFGEYEAINEKDMWVESLTDNGFVDVQGGIKRNPSFNSKIDNKGGCVGIYDPVVAFPPGRVLDIYVKYDINPNILMATRELYLSVQFTMGDNKITTVNRLIHFTNQSINPAISSTDHT